MDDIKVGEYVRLARNQGINKVVEIGDDYYILDEYYADKYGDGTCYLYKYEANDEILKHSPNLIDLIEVGDYVNGDKIVSVHPYSWDENLESITIIEGATKGEIVEEDIKDIVTYEQFESMKYIVGDDKKG